MTNPILRRSFFPLLAAGLGTVAHAEPRTYRAAVIGRTGGGDYGHGYDLIFQNVPGVTVTAVADADESGRRKAMARSGAANGYADHRAMLAAEKPDLVCIAPRRPDCHEDMSLACIEAGVRGIFMEKPFTETPAQADRILAAAEARGVRIQMAHNRRYSAEFQQAAALVKDGFLGEPREAHFHGKQDHRAGGEDLNVLGVHDFDLLRWWFGDPRWCTAVVSVAGRDATREDVKPGTEKFLVAGDQAHATFGFDRGFRATWHSVKRGDHWNTPFQRPREKWGFELHGTKRILAYQEGLGFVYLDSPFLGHREPHLDWQPLPAPPAPEAPLHDRHPIHSLIHAVETGSEPLCSGRDGAWAVGMVAAVYQSHFSGKRVNFPLANRGMGWEN